MLSIGWYFERFYCYVYTHLCGLMYNLVSWLVVNFPGAWWRHQMETFSALLAICAGNSPISGEFPAQRPVMRSFDVIFDLCPNKRLSNQSWGWWFETPSGSLWRQSNGFMRPQLHQYLYQFYIQPLNSMLVYTVGYIVCWPYDNM